MTLIEMARSTLVFQVVAILLRLSPWEYETDVSPMHWVTFHIRLCRYTSGILSIFSKVLTLAMIARGGYHNTLTYMLWFPTRTSIYVWAADTIICFLIAVVFYAMMVNRNYQEWVTEAINMFMLAMDGQIYQGQMYAPPELTNTARAFVYYKNVVYHGLQLLFTCSYFL